jgi:predicted Zn-dependent protease
MSKYYSLIAFLAIALLLGGCKAKDKPADTPKTDSATTTKAPTDKPIDGETFTDSAAQVSVNLPAGWLYESTENDITATSPDSTFAINFTKLPTKDMEVVLAEASKELRKNIKDLKLSEAKEFTVNGMKAKFVEGTGVGEEAAVGIIDVPAANTSLMLVASATTAAAKKYEKEFLYIFENIKPVTK